VPVQKRDGNLAAADGDMRAGNACRRLEDKRHVWSTYL
jgi:hypothetical protein